MLYKKVSVTYYFDKIHILLCSILISLANLYAKIDSNW